jgi:hypothetical protein
MPTILVMVNKLVNPGSAPPVPPPLLPPPPEDEPPPNSWIVKTVEPREVPSVQLTLRVTLPVKPAGMITHEPTVALPIPDMLSDIDELVIVTMIKSPSASLHEAMT